MVEVVEWVKVGVFCRVGFVEAFGETSEEFRESEVCFGIAVIRCRVVENWGTVYEGESVSRPEVAVKKSGFWRMGGE